MQTTWCNLKAAGLLLLAVVTTAACGRGDAPAVDDSPLTLTISGDSVIRMTQTETGSVECPVTFTATVDGPDGSHAVMRGGHIRYYWWLAGTEAGSYELGPQEVLRLWYDTIFQANFSRNSHAQGFGQGHPPELVRGEAHFDYVTSNTREEKRTEPFRFYCYWSE